MSLFFRFFVILFGFLIAYLAAWLIVAYGLLPKWPDRLDLADPEFWLYILSVAAAARFVSPFYIFALSLLVIVGSEIYSFRSLLYYALMGALIGTLAYVLSDTGARIQGTGTVVAFTRELQFMVAGGIVGGFIYWLIAGRRAGVWKGL